MEKPGSEAVTPSNAPFQCLRIRDRRPGSVVYSCVHGAACHILVYFKLSAILASKGRSPEHVTLVPLSVSALPPSTHRYGRRSELFGHISGPILRKRSRNANRMITNFWALFIRLYIGISRILVLCHSTLKFTKSHYALIGTESCSFTPCVCYSNARVTYRGD